MGEGSIRRVVVEKGFGFIVPSDGGPDVFFHRTVVVDGDFNKLKEGDWVEFELPPESAGANAPGPRATRVRPAERPDWARDALSPLVRHPRSRGKKPKWRQG